MNAKIKYLKAMKLLESKEYKDYISQFEKTNERPFNNNLLKMVESLELDPDEVFDKCYIVYDFLNEKFIYKTFSRYYVTPEINTFNTKDVEKIVKWLNKKLNECLIDDILLNEI